MPPRYFKYCTSDVVDLVAGGSLRFASLAWFRQIEQRTGDDVIGDRLEGTEVGHLDHEVYGPDRTAEEDAGLRQRGIQINGAGTVVMQNAMFVEDAGHWLVLCLSTSEAPDLAGSGYDACVEITDIDAFVSALWRTGRLNGRPLAEIFAEPLHGPVLYGEREYELDRTLRTPGASPFRKQKRYEGQHEYRIAMAPLDPWIPDIQYITLEAPSGLLSIVSRATGAVAQARPPAPSKEDVVRALSGLIAEIPEWDRRVPNPYDRSGPGLFDAATQTQIDLELHNRRRSEFDQAIGQQVADAYWDARALGYRGRWERHLDDPTLSAPWMIVEALKGLANDISPGLFHVRDNRPPRPAPRQR